jgi:hypothetical protein
VHYADRCMDWMVDFCKLPRPDPLAWMQADAAAIAAGRGKRQEPAADDLDGVDLDLVGAE